MSDIRVKKAFTLIELVIVIVIVSATYFLVFSTNSFNTQTNNKKISLENLKDKLLTTYDFSESLEFICIDDSFDCYVKVDGVLQEKEILNSFFSEKPEVYEYESRQTLKQFDEIRINDVDYDVVFKFSINNDFKTNEFILVTLENKVYIFNSIYDKPSTYESLSDAFEVFNKNIVEVKDAF